MAVDLSAISSEDLTPVRRTQRSRNGARVRSASVNSSDLAMYGEVRSSHGCAVDVSSVSLRESRSGSGSRRQKKRERRRESVSSVVESGSVTLVGRRPPPLPPGNNTATSASARNASKARPTGKEEEWREGEEEGGGVVVSESVQPGLSYRGEVAGFKDDDDRFTVKASSLLHGGHHVVGLKSGLLSRVRVSPAGNGRVGGANDNEDGEEEEEGEEVADCNVLYRDWTPPAKSQLKDVSHFRRPDDMEMDLPPLLRRKTWKRRRALVDNQSSSPDVDGEHEGSALMTNYSSACSSLHDMRSKELVSDGGREEVEQEDKAEGEEEADPMDCVGDRDADGVVQGISLPPVKGRDSSMITDSAADASSGDVQQKSSEERGKSELRGFEDDFRIRTNLDWVYYAQRGEEGDVEVDEDETEEGCTHDEVCEILDPCASMPEKVEERNKERECLDHEDAGAKEKDQYVKNMVDKEIEKAVVDIHDGGGFADDEPRSPPIARPIWSPQSLECPDAPYARRKRTSIGGSAELARQSSLTDTKLVLTTHLKRNASSFFYDKHFEYLHEIGRGSFSTVYEARDLRSRGVCAVKKSKRQFRGKEDRERYVREIQSVAALAEHPNVVKYFRGWQQDSYFYIQMELCEGGSLRDHLDSLTGLIPEEKVWSWIRQVASGLAHVHKNGVLHLDIKPDNIFIDSQGTLKIGDFGLAVFGTDGDWEEGDGAYVAPELLRGKKPGPEADIYSFGAMVFEWASGERLPRSWAERQEEIKLPSQRSAALNRLVNLLLQLDCALRPSAAAVLEWSHH